MVFLGSLKRITDDKFEVGFTHYMPFDVKNGLNKTETELLQEGALIQAMPQLEAQPGKMPVLCYNLLEKVAWYDYRDIPPVPKTREELLQEQVDQLTLTVLQLQAQINGGV